ncbi:MAG: hypothetical protein J2P26_05805, partial [Nocardiopsaceae bacterium]|nr:hypothetical protein [Nocardiopsaceae bacterium]
MFRVKSGKSVLLVLVCALTVGCGGGAVPHRSSPAGSAGPALKARSGAPVGFSRAGIPLPDPASANTSLGGERQGPPPLA